jgi:Ras-related protein Rab-2A
MEPGVLFRIILVGNAGVGKSCILQRFLEKGFDEKYEVTIGVEFGTKLIKIDQKPIKVQIWDTAGQENYKSITRSFYKRAHGIILMYDVTDKTSFDDLETWLKDIKDYANDGVDIALAGNQVDLADCQDNCREIPYVQAYEMKNKNNFCAFYETSAKTGQNVNELFQDLCSVLYKKQEAKGIGKNQTAFVSLSSSADPRKKYKKCCK